MTKFFIILVLASLHAFSIKCGNGSVIHSKNRTLKQCGRQEYVDLDKSISSPNGIFRIHYTIDGINAVDPIDLNQNNIPDYIDSVAYYIDLVYDIVINEYGWDPPPSDEISSCNGGDGKFDIYVAALDIYNWYGVASLDSETINGEEYSFSFLTVDNNFTDDNYFTKGIEGLKITLAHEYFHSITYFYPFSNKCFSIGCFSLQEMTATAMEKRCFPDSKDYLAYVNPYFQNSWDYNMIKVVSPDGIEAYALSIFIDYLAETTESWDFMKFLYEDNSDDQHFKILDKYLNNQGSSLEEEFVEFSKWCYFSGENSLTDYGFKARFEFPELIKRQTDLFNPSSQEQLTTNFDLNNFTFSVNRVINVSNDDFFDQDTIDLLVTQHDLFAGLSSTTKQISYQTNYSESKLFPKKDNEFISEIGFYYGPINNPNLSFNHFLKQSSSPDINDFVFPNPVVLNDCPNFYIPISYNETKNLDFEVSIYTSDMKMIYSAEKNIEIFSSSEVNALKVISLNSCEIFKDRGVFIYSIDNGDQIKYGKIFVK